MSIHYKHNKPNETAKEVSDMQFVKDRNNLRLFNSQDGWYKDYLESGDEYRMTFSEYKKKRFRMMKKSSSKKVKNSRKRKKTKNSKKS